MLIAAVMVYPIANPIRRLYWANPQAIYIFPPEKKRRFVSALMMSMEWIKKYLSNCSGATVYRGEILCEEDIIIKYMYRKNQGQVIKYKVTKSGKGVN